MRNVYLLPCSSLLPTKHYQDTVLNQLHIDDVEWALSQNELSTLKAKFPEGYFSAWGALSSHKSKWEEMESGDLAFFYRRKNFFSATNIAFKFHSEKLAKSIWGIDKRADAERTWEYMFVFEAPRKISLDWAEVRDALDWKSSAYLMGLNRASVDTLKQLLDRERLWDASAETIKSKDQILSRLKQLEATDSSSEANVRLEQSLLRNAMLNGKTVIKCALCGANYDEAFITTAHIKRRSVCSDEERLDPSVVMPACKFGCDELFERGAIFVTDEGSIRINNALTSNVTKKVANYLSKLDGRQCSGFNSEKNTQYFNWHKIRSREKSHL